MDFLLFINNNIDLQNFREIKLNVLDKICSFGWSLYETLKQKYVYSMAH